MASEDRPDLLLLSVDLAQGSALAPLEAIRQLPHPTGGLPVVLLCDRPPMAEEACRAAELSAAAVLTKPVPLRKLLEVVDDALAKAGQVPVAGRAPAPSGEGVAGSLERMPFPFLLHHLHGLRADGVLHLTADRKQKWVQLRGGKPAAVRSNMVSECLGNLLARSGRIETDVLAESRRRMKGGQLQGEVLVAMAVLSEAEVSQALAEQAEQKFFEIFAWEDGEFRFERDSRLHKANGLAGGRSPADLILHGVRTRTPIERIDAMLERRTDRVLARTESPFYRFQELELEPKLRSWIEGLDGVAVGQALGADKDRRRCLYALLATGFLTLRARGAGRAAPAPENLAAPAPRRAPEAPTRFGPREERVRAELAELAAA